MEIWGYIWWSSQISCLTKTCVNQENQFEGYDYLKSNYSTQMRWFNSYGFKLLCLLKKDTFFWSVVSLHKKKESHRRNNMSNTLNWRKMWNLNEWNFIALEKHCICRVYLFFFLLPQVGKRSASQFTDLLYTNEKSFVRASSISIRNCMYGLLTALEAHFVPFQSTSNPLFRSINGLATFGAFWMFHRLERHFYTVTEKRDPLFACISLRLHQLFAARSRYVTSILLLYQLLFFNSTHTRTHMQIKKCQFVEYAAKCSVPVSPTLFE